MNTMNEVNTDSVEPTAQVTGLENVFREDEVQESLPQEKVMELAPESEGGYIKVNAVFSTSE